jgi:hypothetical protein
MSEVFRPNWISYFLSSSLVLVLSCALSGCRLGNFKEENLPRTSTQDSISGYYQTEPQSMGICTLIETSEDAQCAELPLSQIPAWVQARLANPVAVKLENKETGYTYLFDPNGNGSAFEVFFTDIKEKEFAYSSAALAAPPSEPLWKDGFQCNAQLTIQITGHLRDKATKETLKELPLSGRAKVNLLVIDQIVGSDCAAALTEMQACYIDATQCGGETESENQIFQDHVFSWLQVYIDKGALAVEEIPFVDILAYEVSYQ